LACEDGHQVYLTGFLCVEMFYLYNCCVVVLDDQLGDFLEALNLPTKQYVFVPVNDNVQREETGGSHWWVKY
jgi:hypothetical protein